jgi:hypothetical protein
MLYSTCLVCGICLTSLRILYRGMLISEKWLCTCDIQVTLLSLELLLMLRRKSRKKLYYRSQGLVTESSGFPHQFWVSMGAHGGGSLPR